MISGNDAADGCSPFGRMILVVLAAQARSMPGTARIEEGCHGFPASGMPAFLRCGNIPMRAIRMTITTRG